MIGETEALEEWRAIAGYEGIYEVSSRGRVRSVDRIDPAGRRRVGALRVPQVAKLGDYRVLNLRHNGRTVGKKIHQLVAVAFLGPPPTPFGNRRGMTQINHKNGKQYDNRPENLEYCSPAENVQHAVATGLRDHTNSGERNGRSRLTMVTVKEIRRRHASGSCTIASLSREFGVCRSTIGYVVNGDTWKEIAATCHSIPASK